MKTVLIAGCGYVGSALARRLLAAGYRVLGLKRRPAGLPEGVIPVCCDLADREALRAVLPPAVDSVVLSLAASSSGEEAYEAAYDVALGNLVDALGARSEPPARILFTSSTSVHAQSSGEWVDESSPAEPTHYTGAIMRRAEARVLAAAGPSREAIVLRLGGIYGPGRTRLVEMVRRGEATLTAAPLYTNRIHRDDCAGAIHHLLELERPASLYLGTDAEPA
ncbi:MAG: NAD-dependent epimerase/dehydratase family protein, partial [Myxococcales bacterium]|nr:NAD-dependent epimerase/dehydratase family protein [Myxococcales bacterium]